MCHIQEVISHIQGDMSQEEVAKDFCSLDDERLEYEVRYHLKALAESHYERGEDAEGDACMSILEDEWKVAYLIDDIMEALES